ncbi:MAG: GIY-YIG nuclease family protein [Thermodesulfovibrionales bacterium]|nr:GIY-YIG nuclease family protein [Thermodesulfovibrionales bacterium]
MKRFYVYILSNKRNGTLYTGITSDLIKRICPCRLLSREHKNNLVEGFTQKYNIHRLVWYEIHKTSETAIRREKQTCPCEGRDKGMETAVETKTYREEKS